jgi:exopolysaccharide production protein ExoZ
MNQQNKENMVKENIVKKTGRIKLNFIQVFRGLASLLVVLAHGSLIFHTNLQKSSVFDIFGFGGSGVDFFFVLSGFIIAYVHGKDIGQPTKLKEFLHKRFIRIYPIYWLILTAKLVSSLGSSSIVLKEQGILEFIKAYLLFPQDRNLLSSTFLGVSWTLSYEIFFYLLFCILICLSFIFYAPIITIWIFGVLLNFIGIIKIPESNVVLHFLFNPLNLEFIFGCFAAYLVSQSRFHTTPNLFYRNLLYIGLFLYTLSAVNTYYQIIPISSVIAYGIPSTLMVIGAVSIEMTKVVNFPALLILFGDASYSIYLIHGFVMNNITRIAMKLNAIDFLSSNTFLFSLFALFNAVCAVIVGCFMFLYLEKPLLLMMKPKHVKSS